MGISRGTIGKLEIGCFSLRVPQTAGPRCGLRVALLICGQVAINAFSPPFHRGGFQFSSFIFSPPSKSVIKKQREAQE